MSSPPSLACDEENENDNETETESEREREREGDDSSSSVSSVESESLYTEFDWYKEPDFYDFIFSCGTNDELQFVQRMLGKYGTGEILEPACGTGEASGWGCGWGLVALREGDGGAARIQIDKDTHTHTHTRKERGKTRCRGFERSWSPLEVQVNNWFGGCSAGH
jgi:hypothetical protein